MTLRTQRIIGITFIAISLCGYAFLFTGCMAQQTPQDQMNYGMAIGNLDRSFYRMQQQENANMLLNTQANANMFRP